MRDEKRRIFLIAAAAVMSAAALVPGAVPAGQSTAKGPSVTTWESGGTRIERLPAAVPDDRTWEAAEPIGGRAPVITTQENGERSPAAGAEIAEDGSDPSTWVANVDILGTDDRAPPEPPSDGTCPTAKTCDRNVIRHQKWKTATDGTLKIAWRFNDEGRRNLRAPPGLLEGSVRRSMAEWSRWNSNVVFAYAGTTTTTFGAEGTDGSCADGTNTVTWNRFDPSVIAAVVTCIDPKTNSVRDADLALNVTQHWEHISGEPDSRHTFDIDSIVTHEIGHWLSLLDLYDAEAFRQTMMGNAEYGETQKRTLALGDVVGLQKAYPCADGDVCPREGIVDD